MTIVIVSITILLEALSVVCCLHYLYGEKIRIDISTLCFVALDIVLMDSIFCSNLDLSWSLMIYPIIFFYCLIEFKCTFKSIFTNFILYIVIIGSLQATIMTLYGIIFNIQKTTVLENLGLNGIIFLIVIIGLKKCKLKKLSESLQKNDKLIIVSSIVTIVSIIILILNYKQNSGFNLLIYILLGISTILIIIIAIDIGKHKIKASEAEAELRLHKLYEESFRDLIDEICARQHEFDNHISAIYSQHKLYKTYDELVEAQNKYCLGVIEENQFNKLLSKGNPIILGFLYSKFAELKKSDITVSYRINIEDLECRMPVYKMVELLGNLLKNAMEAVQKQNDRRIFVMMLEQKEKIQMEIANECQEIDREKRLEFFKKGYSEKGEKRGYGLYNVKRICEEYDAAVVCENENRENRNWLVFKVVINKPL